MSTSVTTNYDALITTTFENSTSGMSDTITKSIPLFNAMEKKGVKSTGTGSRIRRTVMTRHNTDGGSFGKWDVVRASDQNPVEPAFFDWGNYVKPITISTQDKLKNSGKEQIIDLATAKMDQARISLKKDLNLDLYGNGGANKLLGMKSFGNKDTYTSDTYGGLSRATYSGWRPYVSQVGAYYDSTSGDGAENLLNKLQLGYITTSTEEQGTVDLILTSIQGLDYYETRAFNKLRFTSNKTADAGFENVKYKGAEMVADPYLDSTTYGTNQGTSGETYYGLNLSVMELVVLKGADMKVEGPKMLEEQLGTRWDLLYIAQLINNNPRACFVLWGATSAT